MQTAGTSSCPLWRHDVEVRVELVYQGGEGRQHGLIAVQLDLPGLGELTGGGLRPGDDLLKRLR